MRACRSGNPCRRRPSSSSTAYSAPLARPRARGRAWARGLARGKPPLPVRHLPDWFRILHPVHLRARPDDARLDLRDHDSCTCVTVTAAPCMTRSPIRGLKWPQRNGAFCRWGGWPFSWAFVSSFIPQHLQHAHVGFLSPLDGRLSVCSRLPFCAPRARCVYARVVDRPG